MYTVFAITMVVTGFGALLIAVFNFHYARQEVHHTRALCERYLQAEADRQMLRSKIDQALAERIRALETYRRTHTDRLNELEDRFGCETQADERSEVVELSRGQDSIVTARDTATRGQGNIERTMAAINRSIDALTVGDSFEIRDMTDADKLNEAYARTLDRYRVIGRY